MSVRYCVVVQLDHALRVYGTYRDRDRAEAFAEKINARIEAREEREFAAWQKRPYDEKDLMPDGYGRAGVLIVHPPRINEGTRFGMTGNPNKLDGDG